MTDSPAATDPRVAILEAQLAAGRADLRAAVRAVPVALLETPPAVDRWSVAAVLEHLLQTEQAVARLLARRIGEVPPRSADEPFVEETFVRHVAMEYVLDRSTRLVGPQPPGELGAAAARTALEESRVGLLGLVGSAAGRRLEDASHAHPFLGELDLYRWIAFVGLHEARHAHQIREITRQLEGVGGGRGEERATPPAGTAERGGEGEAGQ